MRVVERLQRSVLVCFCVVGFLFYLFEGVQSVACGCCLALGGEGKGVCPGGGEEYNREERGVRF